MHWKLISVLGLGLLGGESDPVTHLAEKNGWRTDYEVARVEARQSGKPLMVVFRCQP